MARDMGEYAVGAYLHYIMECDVVDYGARRRGGGKDGQYEFDVIGFDFDHNIAYLCEVATHLRGGLNYGGHRVEYTIEKVIEKHLRQTEYSEKHLSMFSAHVYMFWSTNVPKGKITKALEERAPELELFINERYTSAIRELETLARIDKSSTANPFFRCLQILHSLR